MAGGVFLGGWGKAAEAAGASLAKTAVFAAAISAAVNEAGYPVAEGVEGGTVSPSGIVESGIPGILAGFPLDRVTPGKDG